MLQRLGLSLTWATPLQPFISWLPTLARGAAVEPALAGARAVSPAVVASVPLASSLALAVTLTWCAAAAAAAAAAGPGGGGAGPRKQQQPAALGASTLGGALWRALRAAASWLFIPLLSTLLSVYSCGSPAFDPWTAAGYTCWAGVHLALTVANTVAAVALVGGGIFLSAVTTSTPLEQPSRAARSHGRADAGALAVDTLLVIVLCAPLRGSISPVASGALAFAGACAWLCLSLAFLPHVLPSSNSAVSGALSAHVWVAACGLLQQLDASDASFEVSTFLVIGLLPCCGCGFGLAELRSRVVAATPVADLSSVYAFEIKVCAPRLCVRVCLLVCVCVYVGGMEGTWGFVHGRTHACGVV